jgi:acyl-CoA synthetase (AMP-forming)/AMP-acid ligase II
MAAERRTVAMVYGCSLVGATCVPLNSKAKPYQLRRIIDDAAPAIVIGDQYTSSSLAPTAFLEVDQVWSQVGARAAVFEPVPGSEGLAFLLYTSGSTSDPKAVMAPHAQVLFAAGAIQSVLSYRAADVVFCRIPLSFDYGLYQIFLCALAGAELVLADPDQDARILSVTRASRASVVPLVPSLAKMLVGLAGRERASTEIRLFTNTGEALSSALIAQLRRHFPSAGLRLMFGTTECKRISIAEADEDLTYPGSVGRALPDTAVTIEGPDGLPLPHGQVGEIVVEGPHVMAGYWHAPELTERVFQNSRLRTGDYGWLDEDGRLYFEGRRDNIFKRRGVRTSTAEIEAAARDIHGVRDAVVLPPLADRDAVLCVVGGHGVDVLRELSVRLEPAKVPGILRTFDAFPLNSNGKLDRVAIASRVAEAVQ